MHAHQLGGRGRAGLDEHDRLVSSAEHDTVLDHGIGGVLVQQDRGRGTMDHRQQRGGIAHHVRRLDAGGLREADHGRRAWQAGGLPGSGDLLAVPRGGESGVDHIDPGAAQDAGERTRNLAIGHPVHDHARHRGRLRRLGGAQRRKIVQRRARRQRHARGRDRHAHRPGVAEGGEDLFLFHTNACAEHADSRCHVDVTPPARAVTPS